MRAFRVLGLVAFLAAVVSSTGAVRAQCGPQWLAGDGISGVDDSVSDMITWDPDGPGHQPASLVLGGRFRIAGTALARNVAVWDGASWSALGSGISGAPQGSNGPYVLALAALPNGNLVAGGFFTTAGGAAANNIARWDGTAWEPLGAGIDAGFSLGVADLAVLPNGDLIAGGDFQTAGGVGANGIARWDGTAWSSMSVGLNQDVYNYVSALAILPNGDLVAGGRITLAGSTVPINIARWNGATWSSLGSGLPKPVDSLAILPNGDITAAYYVSSSATTGFGHVVRWNGTAWTELGLMSGYISALEALPNGEVIACGYFGHIYSNGGMFISGLARWNENAGWSSLGSGLGGGSDPYADTLAVLPDGSLVVTGDFLSAGGIAMVGIARWDGVDWSRVGPWTHWTTNTSVDSLAVLPNGDVVAGGSFVTAGGTAASRIARWNGTAWSALGSGMAVSSSYRRGVNSLAILANGDLVAGGSFYSAGGTPASSIARWDGTAWSPLGAGMNTSSYVFALAVMQSGDLAAGGDFTSAGGTVTNCIARWNGTAWSPFGSRMANGSSSASVNALAVLPNGDLIAGGAFTSAGGSAANNIALWNGAAWEPLGSGLNATVYALVILPNGDLVAGGRFTTAGGMAARRIARWDGTAWSPLGTGLNQDVLAVTARPNGDVVAAGYFSTAGGVAANHIAHWNGTSWSPLGSGVLNVVGGASVRALATLPNGDLVAGGVFTSADSKVSTYWARWTDSPTPWVCLQPQAQTACARSSITISATPANGYTGVSYQWRRNGVDILDGPGGASPEGGTVSGASGVLFSPTDATAAVLSITASRPSDSGEYTVVFTNPCGSATSDAARISVCLADYNCDGFVDGIDYDVFNNDFEAGNLGADINGDGFIDGIDYSQFIHGFELGC